MLDIYFLFLFLHFEIAVWRINLIEISIFTKYYTFVFFSLTLCRSRQLYIVFFFLLHAVRKFTSHFSNVDEQLFSRMCVGSFIFLLRRSWCKVPIAELWFDPGSKPFQILINFQRLSFLKLLKKKILEWAILSHPVNQTLVLRILF